MRSRLPAAAQIEKVNIPRPREGDAHSKYGFVSYAERVGAMRAVEDPTKPEMDGTPLNVRRADGRERARQAVREGGRQ